MEETMDEILAMIKEDLSDEEKGSAHYEMLASKMEELGHNKFVPILRDIAKEEKTHHRYILEMMHELEK